MREEAGFRKALAEEPGDETTRLAFADWLEERDDPRAAWVRDPDLFRFATPAVQDPLPGLIAALGQKKTEEIVLRGLARLGERAVPPLIERMRTDDRAVRDHVRQVVVALGPAAVGCLRELRRMLGAEDVTTLRAAAEMLAAMGPAARPALPRLLKLLNHEDIEVRTEVASAIAALKDIPPSALPALRKALQGQEDDDPDDYEAFDALRGQVIRAIGALGPAAIKLVPELMGCLIHGGEVAEDAVDVMIGLGPGVVGPLLDEAEAIDSEEYEDASYVLVGLGPTVIPLLADVLADPQRSGAAKAIVAGALAEDGLREHLSEHAPRIVALLAEGLQHPDYSYRRDAAFLLGQLGERARPAAGALREALRDGNISDVAATALSRIGQGKTGLAVLARELRHKDPDHRRDTVLALSRLGTNDVLPLLLRALQDPDNNVRGWAARGLADRARPQWSAAIEPLRRALSNDEDFVRRCSAEALGKIGPGASACVPDLLALVRDPSDDVRAAALDAVRCIAPGSPEALKSFRSALGGPAEGVQCAAVRGLREYSVLPKGVVAALGDLLLGQAAPWAANGLGDLLGGSEPTPAWALGLARRALREGESSVRNRVAEALAKRAASAAEAIPDLLVALEDDDASYYAACALAAAGPDGLAPLAERLTHPQERVRSSVAAKLGWSDSLPASLLPRLLAAAEDSSARVRDHTAAAVSKVEPKSPEALLALVRLVDDDNDDVRYRALHSLGEFGPLAAGALPRILPRLADSSSGCRAMAATTLGKLGVPERVVPALRRALHDFHDTVRASAAQALGQIGPTARAAVADLRALAKDPDAAVRGHAAAALEKITA